jgi:hypothetical protein
MLRSSSLAAVSNRCRPLTSVPQLLDAALVCHAGRWAGSVTRIPGPRRCSALCGVVARLAVVLDLFRELPQVAGPRPVVVCVQPPGRFE